ncbi:hypothetical protein [Nitrosomonas communis]|uniref:Uncharacterized protein n=1 Tax=Nitrosomonas communis TaxID=44574 RepID=A0A1I4JMB0_9PROT|nr:hypothetical protein [Nitrosomonas communis]SFL67347.1 hypothetical protein SAMN05421863_1002110 [Nitrosomonas communis]
MTQRTKLVLKESYAILANFNIFDIVEPDNLKKIGKVIMIIRAYRYTERKRYWNAPEGIV